MPSFTLKEYLGIGKLVAILLLLAWAARINDLRARWHHQYTAEHSGRLADRAAYAKAQADAAVQNKVQVAKVEQQSKKVSDDERQAYLRDLAQLRAARLHAQSPAAPSSPGRPGPSPAPASSSGTNADGLQVPSTADVREDAAEIELRLMHLQRWVAQQLTIDPNEPANGTEGK